MDDYKEYIVRVYSDRTIWFNSFRKVHREDGPAIEWANKIKQYFLNGNEFTEIEFYLWKKLYPEAFTNEVS